MGLFDQLQSVLVKPKAARELGQNGLAESVVATNDFEQKTRRILIEKRQYIFGMEWRLLPPTRALTRTLKLARQEGMVYYVLSEMEDLIGLSKEISNKGGIKYSAALHLASKMAQGGIELYVFLLQKGVYAVVALNESRPIPGFDFLGPQEQAQELVEEFKAIQAGHNIRLVGNTGLYEGEENVEPEDVFGEPSKTSRIKSIPGQSGAKYIIALAVILGLSFLGAMYWLNEQRKAVMEDVRAVEVDPSKEYKASLQNSLRALPPAGPRILQDWLKAIDQLPLIHEGWRLSKIECKPEECTAQWERVYGSYKDFNKQLPLYTVAVKEVQEGTDPLKVSIITTHRIQASQAVPVAEKFLLQYKDLPTRQEGFRALSSQLQELSLLGSMNVSISQPKIFGANGEVNNVKEAISSGDWSIEHDVWSLPEISIAPNMITKALVLIMAQSKEKQVNTYRLEGTYYVQEQ